MLEANCRIPTSRPHWYLRNWRAHWCHWLRWWDSVLDGALNKIVWVEADWWVELFVNNLKSELITVSMTMKLLSSRRVSGWVLNGLVHTKDDDIIIGARTQQKLNANLWAVRGVIGTDDAMQDTISDLLFHHDIRKVVGGWTTHLGIRVVPQVAVCWNIFL